MLRSFLPHALGLIPPAVRRLIIGRSDQPSRMATVFHNLVNYAVADASEALPVPRSRFKVLKCRRIGSVIAGYIYGNWEPVATEAILSYVQRGMCVFDIGAHLGYYSLLLAKCVGPAGRVVSFEAALRQFFQIAEKYIRKQH